jgi:peptidyl-prolyl cis-trans isomerase A (cyclophilin A)
MPRPPRLAPIALLAALAVASLVVVACGAGPSALPVTPETPAASEAPPASVAPAASELPAASPLPAAVHHAPAELAPSLATARAPDVFSADFTTNKGDFVIEVHRAWAPNGADRFYNLVKLGFFDDTRFFRAIRDFMVQFGIPGDPQVAAEWQNRSIPDDPVTQSNLRGYATFAQTGAPNSRTTQIFIVFENHTSLDSGGFAPFGKVTKGMEVVDSFYKGYGEGAPSGHGPAQDRIQAEGNAYLDQDFPKLDRVLSARIVSP